MKSEESAANLKVGDLSRLCGVSVHSLRIWERRYGSPKAIRTESGHRRYAWSEVERLRAVSVALNNGFRVNQVIGASLEELRSMIESKAVNLFTSSLQGPIKELKPESKIIIESWIDALHQFQEQKLHHSFQSEWARKGMINFIDELAVPFIGRLGEAWSSGEITVAEEHYASGKLGDFLSGIWRHQNSQNTGSQALLATLPEEDHGLGLLMAAVTLSHANYKVINLGVNTPYESILEVAHRSQPALVCLSISSHYSKAKTKKMVNSLRKELPQDTVLIVGGKGAPSKISNVIHLNSFKALFDFALKHHEKLGKHHDKR